MKTKTKAVKTLITGLVLGTWDATFEAIAKERNSLQKRAQKLAGCLIEKFEFTIHPLKGGVPAVRPVATLSLPRTKSALERAASEWAAQHQGKPFQVTYVGWYDGSNCLPRYNSPINKGDRIERMVTFTLPVYTHTGILTTDTNKATRTAQAWKGVKAQV